MDCNTSLRCSVYLGHFWNRLDAACSARSLATLLVAWVCAAMIASILLRWSYLWIALAILTLIFLIACGYAACNTRRPHADYFGREQCRRQRQRNIETVTGQVDRDYCPEPPRYQTYYITDLPPPYSSPNIGRNTRVVSGDQIPPSLLSPSPPSYDAAMQSSATANRMSRQVQRTSNSARRNWRSQSYSPPRTCDNKKSRDESHLSDPRCVPTIIPMERTENVSDNNYSRSNNEINR